MVIKDRKCYLKVLDNKWDDIETYILNIPDSEIRSALLFFVGEDIEQMVEDIKELEEDFNYLENELDDVKDELRYSKFWVEQLEEKLQDLKEDINDFQRDSLDWEMAMDTFYENQHKILPRELEEWVLSK